MATKAVQLKKRLIRDAVISLVLLIMLAAGAYEVSDYDDQAQSEKQHEENENNRLRSENESIQAQLNSGAEVSTFYDNYIKNHNSSFLLDREAVTQLLAILRERNHLVNMAVTISPVTDVAGDIVPLKDGKMVQSEVKLTFNALTDNSVYGFIESMQRQLPGIVLVRSLKITKTGELTGDILRELSKHKIDPLAAVELSFTWVGIRSNTPNSTSNSLSGHTPLRAVNRGPRNGQ